MNSIVSITIDITLVLVTLILSFPLLKNAIKGLKEKSIDENLLMLIVVVTCLIIGDYLEGFVIIVVYNLSEFFLDKLQESIKKSISKGNTQALSTIRRFKDNTLEDISIEDISIGDRILINEGEIIPSDGIVESGNHMIDYSSLTGESNLISVGKGSEVFASGVLYSSSLIITVNKNIDDWIDTKIKKELSEAIDVETRTEGLISKAASIIVPTVLILFALISFVLPIFLNLILGNTYSYYMNYTMGFALKLIIVSCPCALLINIPLIYFITLGKLAKAKILVKNAKILEDVIKIDYLVCDKTGTLTSNVKLVEFVNNTDIEDDLVKKIIVSIECYSTHPKGKSIIKVLEGISPEVNNVSDLIIERKGIKCKYLDYQVIIGSNSFVNNLEDDERIYYKIGLEGGYIKIEELFINRLESLIKYLNKSNITSYIASGDAQENVVKFANEVGITNYSGSMTPVGKQELIRELSKTHGVCFVGDGINDVLAIKEASIGISMTKDASQLAKQTSDITIINNDINSVATLLDYSKFIHVFATIILFFVLGFKLAVLLISSFWFDNVMLSILGDVGISFLCLAIVVLVMNIKKVGVKGLE